MNLLHVVQLSKDCPENELTAGETGTLVQRLDSETWLVEFEDDNGVTRVLAALPERMLTLFRSLKDATGKFSRFGEDFMRAGRGSQEQNDRDDWL